MRNLGYKAAAAVTVTALAIVGFASSALAQTFDPGAEATTVVSANWSLVLDLVKDLAPIAIGTGLVLLAIRKVVGAFRRGRSVSA